MANITIEQFIDKNIISCATCKYASKTEYNLYHCLNTEVNITSHNTKNFYCAKWESKGN